MVRPRRQKREDLVARYGELLRRGVELIEFGETAAECFADIRLQGTKPADAIQLAGAAQAGVDLFITNDDKLIGLRVPGITFITTIEAAPL